jgi:hypothetical protein
MSFPDLSCNAKTDASSYSDSRESGVAAVLLITDHWQTVTTTPKALAIPRMPKTMSVADGACIR